MATSSSYTNHDRNDSHLENSMTLSRVKWPDEAWFSSQNYLDIQDLLDDVMELDDKVSELKTEVEYTKGRDFNELEAKEINIQFDTFQTLVTDIRNKLKSIFKKLTQLIKTYYSDKRTWFNKGRRAISYLNKSDDPKQQQDAIMKNLEARRLCLYSYINVLLNEDEIGRGDAYFTTMDQFTSNLNLFINWLDDCFYDIART